MEPKQRLLVFFALAAGVALFAQCSTHNGPPAPAASDPGPEGETGFPARADAGTDAGGAADAGLDGGADAGLDGGTDAGKPLVLPSLPHWKFYGPEEGGPRRVWGVSSDQAGNIWVAGGEEGLFLLASGATTFRRFTVADGLTPYLDANGIQQQAAISVAGGPGGTVYVGYRGHWGGQDENDPPDMVHSGGVDKVVLGAAGIGVTHLEIATPAGTKPEYPAGRYKIRDVFRIAYNHATGDAWFGGNHGIAMWHAARRQVLEHQHAAIGGYLPSGAYTMLTGDYFGIGLDPAGDVWFGGGNRMGKLTYASEGGQFWSPPHLVDVWPDAVQADPRPFERTDDLVQDLAIARDGTVWVGSIANGLAHLRPGGTDFYTSGFIDRRVTALEYDPKNGSLWVGHIWGGITRLSGGSRAYYDTALFGAGLVDMDVTDIQSDELGGRRRILVAFGVGAIGIYSGD